jgi:hypothetical protein
MRSSSGNASYVFWSETGVADRGILGFNNGSSTLSYRSASSSFATGTEVFSITSAGNATVTGTLTVNSSSSFAGLIQLNNNVAQYWLDSGATQRRTALVSSGNSTYFGPVDSGWGSTGYFSAGTTMVLRTNGASGTFNEAVSISTGGLVTIPSTSASTTTSTGALVVGNGTSGGLGVGGAIVAGGTITSTASTDSGLLQLNLVNSSTGTSASSLFRFNAGTRTASLQAYNDTHATLAGQLRVGTSNGDIVLVPSGVASATFTASGTTFAGAIAIGNTVNTVSPTSPNRTITMVIGGTTYYLAAKTTND